MSSLLLIPLLPLFFVLSPVGALTAFLIYRHVKKSHGHAGGHAHVHGNRALLYQPIPPTPPVTPVPPPAHAVRVRGDLTAARPTPPSPGWLEVFHHLYSHGIALSRSGQTMYAGRIEVIRYLDPHQSGHGIAGTVLAGHLIASKVLNTNAMRAMLRVPALLPDEWKKQGNTTVFWGTIYKSRNDGKLYVGTLRGNGNSCFESYLPVDGIFDCQHPAAMLR